MSRSAHSTWLGFWNDKKIVKQFVLDPPSSSLKKFLAKFKRRKFIKVFDVGCGGGRNTELAIKLGFDVYACDSAPAMVRATRKRLEPILRLSISKSRIIRSSMSQLPYPDNFFDIVISNGVLHNAKSLPELKLAIKESSRVLKEKAHLYLNTFYYRKQLRDLKKFGHNNKYLYHTNEGLYMILLSKNELLHLLWKNKLQPMGKVVTYKKRLFTGWRNILRGIFLKLAN